MALWYLNKKKAERQELVNVAKEMDMEPTKIIIDRLLDRLLEATERARVADENYRVKLEAAHSAERALDSMRTQTATECAAYKKRNGELIELLREWMRTPYFKDKRAWKKWADDFRARITALIGR